MLKVSKIIEIKLLKHKNIYLNKPYLKEKQNKLKEILKILKKIRRKGKQSQKIGKRI